VDRVLGAEELVHAQFGLEQARVERDGVDALPQFGADEVFDRLGVGAGGLRDDGVVRGGVGLELSPQRPRVVPRGVAAGEGLVEAADERAGLGAVYDGFERRQCLHSLRLASLARPEHAPAAAGLRGPVEERKRLPLISVHRFAELGGGGRGAAFGGDRGEQPRLTLVLAVRVESETGLGGDPLRDPMGGGLDLFDGLRAHPGDAELRCGHGGEPDVYLLAGEHSGLLADGLLEPLRRSEQLPAARGDGASLGDYFPGMLADLLLVDEGWFGHRLLMLARGREGPLSLVPGGAVHDWICRFSAEVSIRSTTSRRRSTACSAGGRIRAGTA
jgi:hypothetical protein